MVVDFHAEMTSEKVAMGWHLDGRVAAVLGTHTHVPTADARVLPGGTAHISDVGMTGSRAGVIGVKRDQALESMITQMPVRFETAEEDVWVMGVLVVARPDGLAESIEQILVPARPEAGQRDQDQRQEPDDVEVEPVLGGQLDREHQGGAQGGDLDQALAPRDGRRGQGEQRRWRR